MTLLQELQSNGFDILPGMDNDLLDRLELFIKHNFDGQVYDVSNISPSDDAESFDLSPLGDFWLMTRGQEGCMFFFENDELLLVPLFRNENNLTVIGIARVDDAHIDVIAFEKTDACYGAIFDAAMLWVKRLAALNARSNRTH